MPLLRPHRIWRDDHQPLRELTLARILSMEDASDRGQPSDLQWLWHHMERIDVTVAAATARRLAFAETLDYQIRITSGPGVDTTLAAEQQSFLQYAYNKIENMKEATRHLATAIFRGFAIAEKLRDPSTDTIRKLDVIPAWYWVKNRDTGRWAFNPMSYSEYRGDPVDQSRLVVASSQPLYRPIARQFYSKALCTADWDTALEVGANPNIFFVAPPGQDTDEKMLEFQQIASQLASNGRGALQNGADIKVVDTAGSGRLPYLERMKYCDEQIVMTATGGLLTMLTQSGSGTLAGGAHSDTLLALSQSDSGMLSEVFQRHVDADLLSRYFPNQPALAYFQFELPQKTDANALLEAVSNLSWAGLTVDPAWLAEKTGMNIIPLEKPPQ